MTLFGILKNIKERIISTAPTSSITISLEDLSQIWLPREEQSMPPAKSSNQTGQRKMDSAFPNMANSGFPNRPGCMFDPLWTAYVEPNIILFQKDGSLPVVKELIDILLTDGHYPSIVVSEKIFNNQTARDLSNISLAQHSLHVAENLLTEVHDYLHELEYKLSIPAAIVAALGHDIGKLPRYTSAPLYSKYDHPIISAKVLVELFSKHSSSPPWMEKVIATVKVHHTGVGSDDNDLADPLRHADFKAREQEVALVRKMPVKDCSQWLSVDVFLHRFLPLINIIETTGKQNTFLAFTHRNMVYLRLETLYDVAKAMYPDANAVDFTFEYTSDMVVRLARKNIIKRLYNHNKLEQGYDVNISPLGKIYSITSAISPHKQFKYQLVPIPVEHFGILPSELEKRKTGWLKTITDVMEYRKRS